MVRLTTNATAKYHRQEDCLNGGHSQDYAVVDIIPRSSVFAESTNYFDLSTVNEINQDFLDNNDSNAVNVNGKIIDLDSRLNFYRRFCNPQISERQRVFFLGQHSKRWGYVSREGVTDLYKRNMIRCDLKLRKGDSLRAILQDN